MTWEAGQQIQHYPARGGSVKTDPLPVLYLATNRSAPELDGHTGNKPACADRLLHPEAKSKFEKTESNPGAEDKAQTNSHLHTPLYHSRTKMSK